MQKAFSANSPVVPSSSQPVFGLSLSISQQQQQPPSFVFTFAPFLLSSSSQLSLVVDICLPFVAIILLHRELVVVFAVFLVFRPQSRTYVITIFGDCFASVLIHGFCVKSLAFCLHPTRWAEVAFPLLRVLPSPFQSIK